MQANYKYKQIMGAAPQGRGLHTKFGNMNINNVEIGSLTMFAEQESLPYSSKHKLQQLHLASYLHVAITELFPTASNI